MAVDKRILPLQSKTIIGLMVILALATTMSLLGRLTPELVEVIKWVGTAFMSVRVVANFSERKKS